MTPDQQPAAVLAVVAATLGDAVEAIYLYGSAVMGGLRPHSDLDFLVVVARPTTRGERLALIEALAPISSRERRPTGWRPIELTTLLIRDGAAALDFQYGEWLRDEFAAGNVEPAERAHVDLPILLAMALERARVLVASPANELLPPVDREQMTDAMTSGIPDLIGDLTSDTANVLLTLARVWHTVSTHRLTSKDQAADWAGDRIQPPSGEALRTARDVYLGNARDDWSGLEDQATTDAKELVREIRATNS
jgi:predicted nucleotidyltransferase